jgi:hypothetical protein
MAEKIVIFGLGVSGRALYRMLEDKNIVAFIENNKSLDETSFKGTPVFHISKLNKLDFDKIALSGVWINSMLNQLEDEYNIPKEKILQIPDNEVKFSSLVRSEMTDLIVENIYKITKKLNQNCYVIGSSLATLFRNKDLSCVADVDTFLTSQNDAKFFYETLINEEFFKGFRIEKVLYDKDEVFVKRGDIKKIVIQSICDRGEDEPAIIDVSIADYYKENYFVRHGENYIYIPKKFCEGYRYIDYKGIKVQIPKYSEEYLDLLYGKGWIIPPKKWDQSDYGNLMTENEARKYKEGINE